MAKDRTRERKLPNWLSQRTPFAARTSPALRAYHQTDLEWISWCDVYGAFRQGARVRS